MWTVRRLAGLLAELFTEPQLSHRGRVCLLRISPGAPPCLIGLCLSGCFFPRSVIRSHLSHVHLISPEPFSHCRNDTLGGAVETGASTTGLASAAVNATSRCRNTAAFGEEVGGPVGGGCPSTHCACAEGRG